jgi:hypothetical protein
LPIHSLLVQCWWSKWCVITTREVLINDATLSSRKTLKSSPRIFCDELVMKWVSSWNERHWLSMVTKWLFSS